MELIKLPTAISRIMNDATTIEAQGFARDSFGAGALLAFCANAGAAVSRKVRTGVRIVTNVHL